MASEKKLPGYKAANQVKEITVGAVYGVWLCVKEYAEYYPVYRNLGERVYHRP